VRTHRARGGNGGRPITRRHPAHEALLSRTNGLLPECAMADSTSRSAVPTATYQNAARTRGGPGLCDPPHIHGGVTKVAAGCRAKDGVWQRNQRAHEAASPISASTSSGELHRVRIYAGINCGHEIPRTVIRISAWPVRRRRPSLQSGQRADGDYRSRSTINGKTSWVDGLVSPIHVGIAALASSASQTGRSPVTRADECVHAPPSST